MLLFDRRVYANVEQLTVTSGSGTGQEEHLSV